MEKRKILLVIDGSSIINSCYYATMPNYILTESDKVKRKTLLEKLDKNKDGLYVNGVKAMVKVLFKLLREQRPSHIAVTWDITRDTFRKKIYSEYKGTRDEVDEPLKEQFKTMQNILEKMKIPQFYDDYYEADDYIGSLANRFEDEIPVYIYTKDKDTLQLVSDRTKLWLISDKSDDWCKEYGINKELFNIPHNAFEFNPEYVNEIFGVYPELVVDLKALLGDKGDNIPGVKGVGKTSAIPLINHYNTIENLFSELEDLSKDDLNELKRMWKDDLEIKRSPINTLLKEDSKNTAVLSKKLAQIVTDIDLKVNIDDLKVSLDVSNVDNVLKEYDINVNSNNIF